jgi:hypothetical protein
MLRIGFEINQCKMPEVVYSGIPYLSGREINSLTVVFLEALRLSGAS